LSKTLFFLYFQQLKPKKINEKQKKIKRKTGKFRLQTPSPCAKLSLAVTLIAVKREVAARPWQVFRGANVKLGNWRQVTVPRQSVKNRDNV